MVKLFGWSLERQQEEKEPVSFAPEQKDDGAMVVSEGGIFGTYVDLDGAIRNEAELVSKYRDMATLPEVDYAIDDIVNEAIVNDPVEKVLTLNLDDLKQPDNIKNLILYEFNNICELLEFNQLSYEVFRRWYVDGRLYYHAIIDERNPGLGIQELRYIDPRKIRKIRQIKKGGDKVTRAPVQKTVDEYYIYNDKGFSKPDSGTVTDSTVQGVKISKDAIVHCTSGLTNVNGDLVLSYLHKAIKPLNILRSMEDSLVIYRVSRAPERRIFSVEVGNLPKIKAEQYLRDTINRYKNKVVFDQTTGEIRTDRKFSTMLEDFFLPMRDGRGNSITTLQGGQNLSEIEDVVYFRKLLYNALNVPVSRMESDNTFNFGRATEISRDEVKFSKFITRLRGKFALLFSEILKKQLILKGIIVDDDWNEFKENLKFVFNEDNYFAELKDNEIMQARINLVNQVIPFVGKYFSNTQIRKKILMQSDEEIEEVDAEIGEEMQNPQYNQPSPLDPQVIQTQLQPPQGPNG